MIIMSTQTGGILGILGVFPTLSFCLFNSPTVRLLSSVVIRITHLNPLPPSSIPSSPLLLLLHRTTSQPKPAHLTPAYHPLPFIGQDQPNCLGLRTPISLFARTTSKLARTLAFDFGFMQYRCGWEQGMNGERRDLQWTLS